MNPTRASVEIDIEITDASKLHEAATEDFVSNNGGNVAAIADAADFLGDKSAPNVGACLRQIFDRPLPDDCGIAVSDSRAEIDLPTPPRTSTVMHMSTAHLRPAEREAITQALGLDVAARFPEVATALVHAMHCGLFVKPKDCGFFVRLPWDEGDELPGLTPEMDAILKLAKRYGAWMIDFDCDEEPLADLPFFGDTDREFIIRDFATGIQEGDEPLYWNNMTGWGSRETAERFPEHELADHHLPLMGSEPGWVDAADPTDQRYQAA